MKARNLILTAVLAGLPLFGNAASAVTIELLQTFDFPGGGQNTEPQKINERGDIVGAEIDSATGVTKGFYRDRHGNFSAAFADPNDTAGSTQGRGVNDSRVICGNYGDATDSTTHGFFLAHHVFTEFDVPGFANTLVLGINNAGDFAGTVISSDGTIQDGFVSIGGTITTFAIPDAVATLDYQINASNQSVGYYVDASGTDVHGLLRASDGTLTYPIDPEGSTGTILFGNNNSNWVVGRYSDTAGNTHALFFVTPDEFVSYDYPGSTFTSFNGIDAQGYITGRYVDANGTEHGILARVHLDGTDKSSHTLPAKATKPVLSSPARSGIGAPAM